MENSLRPYVEIELGGAPRKLQYDMNAIAELEDVTGLPVIAGKDPDNPAAAVAPSLFSIIAEQGPGIRYSRALLWTALLHHEPKITLSQAGALITINNLMMVSTAINEALKLFFRQQGLAIPDPEGKTTLLT